MSSSERVKVGSNVAISIIGAMAIVLAANYLGMRHYLRSDWTASGLYTLSDKSLKVLGTLDKNVSLYLLWSQGDPSGRYADVKEILDRYTGAQARVTLEVLDHDLNPERVQMIIDRYGARIRQNEYGEAGLEAGVFVVSGDNVQFVSSAEFEDFGGDMMGGGGEEESLSGFKAEQALTSAVMRVTSDEQAKICFTQGHEEWSFEGFGGRALGHLKDGLTQDGYKVEALSLSGASRIPPGCDLVVVVGPGKAFLEEEATVMQRFVERGGRLLLFLDPLIEGTRFLPTGLEKLSAQFGIKLSRDVVFEVDPRRLVSSSPMTFVASEISTHDAVKHLNLPSGVGEDVKAVMGVYPVVFSMARSLVQREDVDVVAEPLAKSSAASWGEVDLNSFTNVDAPPAKDQYDTQGPASVAMASSLPAASAGEEGGRLVVVGDSDLLAEELFVNTGLHNRDFWSGLVGWLTSRGDLISIAPKDPEHVRLNLTDDDISVIWQVVIGQVLFIVILGVVVWMRRRS